MLILEPNISYGNIFTILTVVISVTALVYTMRGDIRVIKNDIRYLFEGQHNLTEAFTQLGRILTSVAVQDSRINMIEKRIDELAHGRGLVSKP